MGEAAQDYPILPPIAGKHNAFIAITCIMFTILFIERGVYTYLSSGLPLSPIHIASVLALAALVAFVGVYGSFVLPGRLLPDGEPGCYLQHTLDLLFRQWAVAAACIGLSGVVILSLYATLVWPDLLSLAHLTQDVFTYTVLGAVIYHGFITYVRYLGLLYQTRQDDRLKVATFQVGTGVFLTVMGLYQWTMDQIQVLTARPEQGLLAVHLVGRDIWLGVMVLFIFAWQLGRTGDH